VVSEEGLSPQTLHKLRLCAQTTSSSEYRQCSSNIFIVPEKPLFVRQVDVSRTTSRTVLYSDIIMTSSRKKTGTKN